MLIRVSLPGGAVTREIVGHDELRAWRDAHPSVEIVDASGAQAEAPPYEIVAVLRDGEDDE